jgi:hypothetical protein
MTFNFAPSLIFENAGRQSASAMMEQENRNMEGKLLCVVESVRSGCFCQRVRKTEHKMCCIRTQMDCCYCQVHLQWILSYCNGIRKPNLKRWLCYSTLPYVQYKFARTPPVCELLEFPEPF